MQHRITSTGAAQTASNQPIHVHLHHVQMAGAPHGQQHQINDMRHALEHPIKVVLLLFVHGPNVEQAT